MKIRTRTVLFVVALLPALLNCLSGSKDDVRNKDVFDEAAQLSSVSFTTTPQSFNGNIQGLVSDINALGVNTESVYAGTNATIEGVVTIPSDYGVALAEIAASSPTSGCSGPLASMDRIYTRSFILQDANAAILVAYGLEPPIEDIAQSASAKYIGNARFGSLASLGGRIRLTVTKVRKYGVVPNVIPVVTDFSVTTVTQVSSRNAIAYTNQAGAFVRANDLYGVRRLEGYVTLSPLFDECVSTASDATSLRQFQYNFQKGYRGTICTGAVSVADAQTCTGSKQPYDFRLSYNLGAGTLSGFDTGNSYSYNIALNAKVRLTGPVFPPQYNQPDTNLSLMLSQKVQVETLK